MSHRIRNFDKEELWSAIIHGIGILLGMVGVVYILYKSSQSVYQNSFIASFIFGLSILFMYTSSSLYHSIKNKRKKKNFQIVDHISIYFLIAGTYTPFMLIPLNNSPYGITILIAIWIMAFVGLVYKLFFTRKFKHLSLFIYLIMGWLILIDYKSLENNLSNLSFVLLFSGGVVYSMGTIFYAINKIPYNHTIWHIFVLFGTILHYFSVINIL